MHRFRGLLFLLLTIAVVRVPGLPAPVTSVSVSKDTITGTLLGRVLNEAEEPFPGVRVRVTNLETGNTRATQTDSSGRYRIAFIPLGLYSIEAIKDGFVVTRPSRQPIKVQLNRLVEAVPDMILAPVVLAVATPAPLPQQVVESSGRLVNRIDAARRFNLDARQLSELPVSRTRSFDDLALLAPGVAPPPEVKGTVGPGVGSGIGSAGQFAVNGQRARSNNFTVDGSDNNDEDVGVRRQGFVSLVPQSIESVREVQIVTQLWDGELGRNLGSQVNAVTRTGGNQIHGVLYDFFNHDSLNARDFFDYKADRVASYPLLATAVDGFNNGQPINPTTIPVLVRRTTSGPGTPVTLPNPSGGENQFQQQQFGATLGFPVRRDRSFIFASFERQQIISAEESHFAVPTVAQRGFLGLGATGFITTDGMGIQRVFTPTFVAGDAIFSLFPFPNNPVGPYGANTFTQILQSGGTGTNFSMRLDQTLVSSQRGASHVLTVRYNLTDDARSVPSVGGAIFSGVRPQTATHNMSLFLNSQINSRLSNQLRGSFGRSRLKFSEIRDSSLAPSKLAPGEPFLLNRGMLFNGSDPRLPPTFVDYFQREAAADSAEDHLGPVGQVLISPFSPLGADVDLFPQARANNTYQIADTVVFFRGRHNVRFGFDLRRTQLNSLLNRNYRPKVSFGGVPDLTGATIFDPVFQANRSLVRGLSQFGPTPGFFSGTDLAALGLPTGILQALSEGPATDSTIGLRFWQYDFFATDQWRIASGFSITYGLRYQYNTVPRDVASRIERTFGPAQTPDTSLSICKPFTQCGAIFSNGELLDAYAATLNSLRSIIGGRESIYETDRNNFAPHLGFAIDPFMRTRQVGKAVVRGGFSLNYDPALGNVVSQSRNVYPNFVPLNVDANTFGYAGQVFFIPGQTGAFAIFNPKFIPVDILTSSGAQSYGLIASQRLNTIGVPKVAFPQLSGLLFSPPPVRLAGNEFPSGAPTPGQLATAC
ncbi:MAG: TonB-dependent receptor, partial [Acidobacteriota bacterium]